MNTGIVVLSIFLIGLTVIGTMAFFFLHDRLKHVESILSSTSEYLISLETEIQKKCREDARKRH